MIKFNGYNIICLNLYKTRGCSQQGQVGMNTRKAPQSLAKTRVAVEEQNTSKKLKSELRES